MGTVKFTSSCECRSKKLAVCGSERQDTQAHDVMKSAMIGHTRRFLLGRFSHAIGLWRSPGSLFRPRRAAGSLGRPIQDGPVRWADDCGTRASLFPLRVRSPRRHQATIVHSSPQNQGQRKYSSEHLQEAEYESNQRPALPMGKWHCHIHSRTRIYVLANICQEKRGQRGQQPPERLSLVIFFASLPISGTA